MTSDHKIIAALYGDLPWESWPQEAGGEPAAELFEAARAAAASGRASAAEEALRLILAQPDLETRLYLQANHFLRDLGVPPDPAGVLPVLSVVVEVGVADGREVVAAYEDGTARYLNSGGGGVFWDRTDDSLSEAIAALLAAGVAVVAHIGPWDGVRPGAPPEGYARVSMLTPRGLHFGEGPFQLLAGDPMAGPIVAAALHLMEALVAKAGA